MQRLNGFVGGIAQQEYMQPDAATTIMFLKIDKQHWYLLKTILIFLNYMPENEMIDIDIDQNVMEELKRI
jgi:hypothetical protein